MLMHIHNYVPANTLREVQLDLEKLFWASTLDNMRVQRVKIFKLET